MYTSPRLVDEQYQELVELILTKGVQKTDRTGTGTLSLHGVQLRYDLQQSFPLLTLKKTHWPSIVHELLWMMGAMDPEHQAFGNGNIRYLEDHNVKIWSDWAYKKYLGDQLKDFSKKALSYEDFRVRIRQDDDFALEYGELGPIYGPQWTRWVGSDLLPVNQLNVIVKQLKTRPDDRGIMLSAWNVSDLPEMALRPCHYSAQLLTRPAGEDGALVLDTILNMRSNDVGLGNPFNVAQYALMAHLFSQVSGIPVGELIVNLGDAHLNHVEGLRQVLKRPVSTTPVRLVVDPSVTRIDAFRKHHLHLEGYTPQAGIPLPVAV
jgi:thymidylate synthase